MLATLGDIGELVTIFECWSPQYDIFADDIGDKNGQICHQHLETVNNIRDSH